MTLHIPPRAPFSQGDNLPSIPYRAIALDLDGTLLGHHGRLGDRSVAVLRSLAERGIRIILASGRMTARVMPYVEQLAIPVDMVCYNGSEILTQGRSGWETLASRGLSPDAREAVYSLSRGNAVFLNVYSQGKLYGYHAGGDFTWSRHYETNSGALYAGKYADIETLPRDRIQKLLVIDTPARRDALHEDWSPLLSHLCVLTKSNPEYLEFLGKDVSKGSSLSIWLERNGIQPAELVAFGDAENDLEMLRLAGLGIAMANATPGVRSAFNRFSRWSNAEEGVARELATLFEL
ncbi:MAG: HAD family hydrolase [Fibrobacteria bacterium]